MELKPSAATAFSGDSETSNVACFSAMVSGDAGSEFIAESGQEPNRCRDRDGYNSLGRHCATGKSWPNPDEIMHVARIDMD